MLFEKQAKDCGLDSIEYVKTTDSKEQIETVNANVEKHPMGELEAPVTKALEEEKMQDEGILKPAGVHEGFEKVDENVHIRQQAIEVESDLIKIHTISTGDKILENLSFFIIKI